MFWSLSRDSDNSDSNFGSTLEYVPLLEPALVPEMALREWSAHEYESLATLSLKSQPNPKRPKCRNSHSGVE